MSGTTPADKPSQAEGDVGDDEVTQGDPQPDDAGDAG